MMDEGRHGLLEETNPSVLTYTSSWKLTITILNLKGHFGRCTSIGYEDLSLSKYSFHCIFHFLYLFPGDF